MLVLFKSLILVDCKGLGEKGLGKLQIGTEIGSQEWPLDLWSNALTVWPLANTTCTA